jgi:hypothetical protein
LSALPKAVSLPVKVEVAPGGTGTNEELRYPPVGGDKK